MKKTKTLKLADKQLNNPQTENADFRIKMPEWVHLAFSQISDKILWMDAKGKILYANQAMIDFLDTENLFLIGTHISDFDQNPAVSLSCWEAFWSSLSENRKHNYKTFFLSKEKLLTSVEVNLHLQEWEKHSVAFLQIKNKTETQSTDNQLVINQKEMESLSEDFRLILNDWKKAYQELQTKCDALYMIYTRYELVNKALREGFWEIDLPDNLELNEFTPIWFSDQFAHLLGYEPEEFPPILKTWLDKLHPKEKDKVFQNYKAFIQGGFLGDIYNAEYQLLTKSGKYRWFNARAKIQRDQAGKAIREAGALLDINSQKNAEARLFKKNIEIKKKHHELLELSRELAEQKQKSDDLNNLKDRLLSIISHDFRSPLNSLQGVLWLLQDQMISETELRTLANGLSERVKVISTFLDNLLNWAKSQMEGSKVQPSNWNLGGVILTKIKLFQTQAEQKNIKLIAQIPTNISVFADLNMIELVVRNLLSNAIKFSFQGGKIELKAEETQDNFVQISIRDNGVGIPADKIPELFGSEKISTLGTSNEPGTGLGLLLCKDFVEKNGGKIWLESVINQGTCFYFTVPKSSK